jgi:acyl carrier protein
MDKDKLFKLRAIFRIILELPENFDVEKSSKINNRKWDSLAQVSIIVAIENEFGVVIPTRDYERITSFKSTELLLLEIGV